MSKAKEPSSSCELTDESEKGCCKTLRLAYAKG